MAEAACQGMPVAMFFPEQGARFDQAKAVCAFCPVRRPCADHAMADPTIDGLWAGVTGRERARLRLHAS